MAAENQCRNSKKINAFSVTSRQSTGLRNPRLVKKNSQDRQTNDRSNLISKGCKVIRSE